MARLDLMTDLPSRPRLWPLTWPLLAELLLGLLVGTAGTWLAAQLSDTHTAAFSLAQHVSGMLFLLFRIVGAGISVVLSQHLGAGRHEQAQAVARVALAAGTWLGGATALMALWLAWPLMRAMNAPAEVVPLAAPLLQALALSLLLDAWNASLSSVLRTHLHARDTLWVNALMQVVQLALAAVLMLGAGPLPPLGLIGFALALSLSRALGTALFVWLCRQRLGLSLRWPDLWRLPRPELRAMLHIGLPGAAENIAYRLCFMLSLAVVGQMGAQALAVHAYASQLMYFVLLPGLATGLAVEILVGHQIGAGHLHQAHRQVRRALGWGLVVSVMVATAMALASPWLLRQFTQDETLIDQAVTLMWWTVLLEPGRTFNLVVINALRATGDARYPVMVGAGSMALVLAGGSWWLGQHLALGLVGIWWAYAADEWLRGLLMWRRWARLAWVPHARQAHRGRHAHRT